MRRSCGLEKKALLLLREINEKNIKSVLLLWNAKR